MLIRWRPKSSITSVPQLLFSCRGASLMPVDVLMVTSSDDMVSSPPATIVGRPENRAPSGWSIFRLSQTPLCGRPAGTSS